MSRLRKVPLDFSAKITSYTLTILKLLRRLSRTVQLMGSSWFLLDPAPKTNPAKTYTRTRAPSRNYNPAPWQFFGSDQTCTATRPASMKLVPGIAKTTPYPPCTVTAFWLKYQDRDRCLRRVTPTKLYRRAVIVNKANENHDSESVRFNQNSV